jgi:hypothetical protein
VPLIVLVTACSKKEDVRPGRCRHHGHGRCGCDAATAGGDDVEPVTRSNAAAMPLAQKSRDALGCRRSACCSATPGIVVTSEARMLSAALRHHAIDLARATSRTSAYEQTLAGCD